MRKLFTSAALLMAAMTLASCGKTIDLEGYAWNASVTSTDNDGDKLTMEVNMLCTSKNAGTFFISEKYADDEPYGFALPFSYTWEDNQGTVTVTYVDPMTDGVGTATASIPINYSKTTGLVVDLGNLYRKELIVLNPAGLSLEKKDIYRHGSLKKTVWHYQTNEMIGPGGGTVYDYNLHFTSATTAKLTMYMGGYEGGTEEWDITYTYADGVGKMTITGEWANQAETFDGYFYLPDGEHLVFCDCGETYLPMERVTAQPEPNKEAER